VSRQPFKIASTPKSIFEKKPWPPMEVIKRDREANRWFNSRFTTSRSLLQALSYFLTTGWPPASLDDFLLAIMPVSGWDDQQADGPIKMAFTSDNRRERMSYSRDLEALMYGFWQEKK